MVMPNLIHPVSVKVERLDEGATVYDEDAREPVKQGSRKTTYTLPAQVKWGTHDGMEPTDIGPGDVESGYVLFRKPECVAAGYHPKRKDRIVQIGSLTGLTLFITAVQPMGHYPDQNGYTLWKCVFSDRSPVVEG